MNPFDALTRKMFLEMLTKAHYDVAHYGACHQARVEWGHRISCMSGSTTPANIYRGAECIACFLGSQRRTDGPSFHTYERTWRAKCSAVPRSVALFLCFTDQRGEPQQERTVAGLRTALAETAILRNIAIRRQHTLVQCNRDSIYVLCMQSVNDDRMHPVNFIRRTQVSNTYIPKKVNFRFTVVHRSLPKGAMPWYHSHHQHDNRLELCNLSRNQATKGCSAIY